MFSTARLAIKQLFGLLKYRSASCPTKLLMRYHSASSAAPCRGTGKCKRTTVPQGQTWPSGPQSAKQPSVLMGSSQDAEFDSPRLCRCLFLHPHRPTVLSPSILSWFVNISCSGSSVFASYLMEALGVLHFCNT